MEILCKKILTTLLIYSKIAMFECWLLSLAPIFADCVGCISFRTLGVCNKFYYLLYIGWKENFLMRTTFIAKTAEIERKWYVVDATDLTLGRLASQVAAVLRGKNKPIIHLT